MNNIHKIFSWRLILAVSSVFMMANAQGSTNKKVYVMELNNSGFYTQENLSPDTNLVVYTTKNNPNKKVLMYTIKNTKKPNSINTNKTVLKYTIKNTKELNSVNSNKEVLKHTVKNTKELNSVNSNKEVLRQIKKSANSISSKYRILFKLNSYEISAQAKIKLMDIINKANKINTSKLNLKIILIGRTDYTGTETYNYELSKKRALSVKNYITNNSKINPKIISYYSYGESHPIKSIMDRAINRSVTIDILSDGEK